MKSPAAEMVRQFKIIQDTLDKNQQQQFDLIQQRSELLAIPCSADDTVKRLKKMVEPSNERYQDANKNKLITLTKGTKEDDDFYLNSLMQDLTNDKADFNFFLFILQKPIFENIENAVSNILPANTKTMSLEKKAPHLAEFDKKIEKLMEEHDALINEIKESGLVDIGYSYKEVKPDKHEEIEQKQESKTVYWPEHQQPKRLVNAPNPPKQKVSKEHNKNFLEEAKQELKGL